MMTVLMLSVTVLVGVSVLLEEHAAEGVGVVVEDGVQGAEGVEVVARDDVEELRLQNELDSA